MCKIERNGGTSGWLKDKMIEREKDTRRTNRERKMRVRYREKEKHSQWWVVER